ncbi:hypothetical protein SAMD00023353_0801700 [Rosellinia necatrix]|uniref:Secreted protein n=1 Tax=Rosellinia necatrix TaxID=77044 RepID=A0A1S8A619_ROSNE|nr:hypothetical protein SAMD00023353_0801700 [Rosellinia necatrix]
MVLGVALLIVLLNTTAKGRYISAHVSAYVRNDSNDGNDGNDDDDDGGRGGGRRDSGGRDGVNGDDDDDGGRHSNTQRALFAWPLLLCTVLPASLLSAGGP